MGETFEIELHNRQQAWAAMNAQLFPHLKAVLQGDHRYTLTVKPMKRSTEANARLHAMLGWLAKNVKWAGKHQSIDHWKRLATAAWLRAKGEAVEVLPALDGHGVDLVYAATREMSGKQVGELMEWIEFWAADQGFDLPDYQRDPNTGRMVEVRRSK